MSGFLRLPGLLGSVFHLFPDAGLLRSVLGAGCAWNDYNCCLQEGEGQHKSYGEVAHFESPWSRQRWWRDTALPDSDGENCPRLYTRPGSFWCDKFELKRLPGRPLPELNARQIVHQLHSPVAERFGGGLRCT
jgi:hypothetical protein